MKKGFKKVCSFLVSVLLLLTIMPTAGYAETVSAKLGNRGFKGVVDLGVAASDVSLKGALISREGEADVAYTTADGGIFNVVDIKQNKLLFTAQLGEVTQAWTHSQAPDGTVYIAGLAAKNEGELWSYAPSTRQVKKLGTPAAGEQVWSSTVDSAGNVYIGTFASESIPGRIVKYDAAAGQFVDFGQVDSECGYVRSMAYYEGYIYAGLGVSGKVYRINIETKEKEEITGEVPQIIGKESIKDVKFCYDMAVVGDYLFARFDEGAENTLLFYDLKNQQWLDKKVGKLKDGSADDFGTFGFGQVPVYNNKAYVIRNRQIHEIDLNSFEVRATGIPFLSAWRGGAFIEFDNPALPGASLVTLKRNGIIFIANMENNTSKELPCVMEAKPLALHNLGKGPDGNLYMTTYPGGPRGSKFDPRTGIFSSYLHGQAEGMIAGNGNDMYFGIYPGAVIQRMDTETLQIETLFNLKDVYEQDRPYIMQFVEDKLLIGTIPDYKKLGGSLTIYDTNTLERETFRNIVQDQSIVGIAYRDGKIYGSTSVRGGLDIQPAAEKAKMFVWDIAGKTKVTEFELNFPELDKPPMISGLTFDKDGLLWGAVDGIIFAMKPDTYEVVKRKNLYPNIKNRGMWRPVHIIFGEDGLLYTDIGGKLTVADPETLDYVTLVGTGAEVDFIALAKDGQGNENIYFLDNSTTTLKMVPVIDGGEVVIPPVEPSEINVPIFNPGFEEGLSTNRSSGWSSLFSAITANVSFGISTERSKTGNSSLKIVDKAQNETVFVQSDYIPVVPGVEYTASAQLFMEDGSVSFFLRYFDETGKQVGADKDGVNIIHIRSGHKEWQTVKAVVTAPEGAKYARLFAGASNFFTTSAAYFDDFKLTYKAEAAGNVAPGTLMLTAPAGVMQGEEFSIAVEYFASESKDLYALDALLNYDIQKLQLVGIEKAGSFDSQEAVFDYVDNQGSIHAVATQSGANAVSENGEVLILKFKALEVLGETQVTLGKGTKLAKSDSNEEYLIGMDKVVKINISEQEGIPEDINKDGKVNLIDLVAVAKKVGESVNDNNRRSDVNRDGVIDIKDVEQVISEILGKN